MIQCHGGNNGWDLSNGILTPRPTADDLGIETSIYYFYHTSTYAILAFFNPAYSTDIAEYAPNGLTKIIDIMGGREAPLTRISDPSKPKYWKEFSEFNIPEIDVLPTSWQMCERNAVTAKYDVYRMDWNYTS